MSNYSVSVGNVGNIQCANLDEAKATFASYVEPSKTGCGRAAYEDITLLEDGEPIDSHYGMTGVYKFERLSAYNTITCTIEDQDYCFWIFIFDELGDICVEAEEETEEKAQLLADKLFKKAIKNYNA